MSLNTAFHVSANNILIKIFINIYTGYDIIITDLNIFPFCLLSNMSFIVMLIQF